MTETPRVVDLTEAVVSEDNAAEVAMRALVDAQRRLGTIGLAVDMLGAPAKGQEPGIDARLSDHAAAELAHVRDRLRTAMRAVGLLVPALLVAVGLVFAPGGTPTASAATVAAPVASMEAPQPDPLPLFPRHPARFDRGLWVDLGSGDVAVSAPLRELVGSLGWLPSPWAVVNVQQLRRGRWVTVARLQTDTADGRANGIVHVGGGVKYLRVVHPADVWTLATTGAKRRVVVTTEPFDVI
jgi:hypothetical protein